MRGCAADLGHDPITLSPDGDCPRQVYQAALLSVDVSDCNNK